MSSETPIEPSKSRFQRISNVLMASCLGVMAVAVFINVVLRYGFGSGVAASEELSRLLFVWMVFIGATAAYPAGEHMAFTSFVGALRKQPRLMLGMTLLIRLLVLVACLIGYHILLVRMVRQFATDSFTRSSRWLRIFNEVPALLLIGIVILVVVKPF